MSEPIPESIPTSQDPRSKRPLKRRALTPTSQQASQVTALFAKPDRDIPIPTSTALTKKPTVAAPPEIVANVQGSSAGAGSGEFHVYKASRRREYERMKMMDEEKAKENADAVFARKQAEMRRKDEEKTKRNRTRREKIKKRKEGKGDVKEHSMDGNAHEEIKVNDAALPVLKHGDEMESAALPATSAEDIGVIIHDDD